MTTKKILLGYGTVSVGGSPIGLTRGGSSFVVERDYRPIEADGDKGPVKGRIVVDSELAKLTVNALELFDSSNITKYYPALDLDTGVLTSTMSITAGDHNDVVWTGKKLDGQEIKITVKNAINMSNLEWNLEDKNEVVPQLEFTAVYDEDARDTPPWEVEFVTKSD